jgi:Fur family ferric uptake transcriptional regulator
VARTGSPDRETAERGQAVDHVVELLKRNGANRTRQRREIVAEVLDLTGHVSVDDLWNRLREVGSNVHRATIYRTISELEGAGVVRRCQRADGTAVFQVASSGPPHLHPHCQQCGRDTEAPAELAAVFQRAVLRDLGFRIEPGLYPHGGICKTCAPSCVRSPT